MLKNLFNKIMENIFDEILEVFKNSYLLNLNSDNSFEKKHIFFNILSNTIESLEKNERLDMLYFFNCNEKSIQASRNGIFTVAEHWIKRGQDTQASILNPFAQNGMKALYHPAIAYYHYAQKDFKEAIYHQKASIYYLDRLIESEFKEAISAKMEQSLNLIKAYQADHKREDGETLFQSLFTYILIGNKTPDFLYDWNFIEERFDDRVAAMIYYYDSIFFKEIANNYGGFFEENSTINSLNAILLNLTDSNNTEFREFKSALQVTNLYWQGDVNGFLKSIVENNILSDRVPNALRLIISEYCFRIFQEFEHHEINSFEEILKNFVKVHLKISKRNIDKRNIYHQKHQLEFVTV
jgi:hypothetical protein